MEGKRAGAGEEAVESPEGGISTNIRKKLVGGRDYIVIFETRIPVVRVVIEGDRVLNKLTTVWRGRREEIVEEVGKMEIRPGRGSGGEGWGRMGGRGVPQWVGQNERVIGKT